MKKMYLRPKATEIKIETTAMLATSVAARNRTLGNRRKSDDITVSDETPQWGDIW